MLLETYLFNFHFWSRQSITLLFYPVIEERHNKVDTCKYGGETVMYLEAIGGTNL